MVPELTRNVDAMEYDPHHVSICPYHRCRMPHIRRDDDKLASLNTILSAAMASNPNMTVEAYLTELAAMERRARSCYADSFDDMTSLEFLRMLLLDACYVLHRFSNVHNGAPVANGNVQGGGNQQDSSSTATASAAGGVTVAVLRDVLYLVENQIPYFIVDKIHNLTFSSGSAPAVNAMAECVSKILQRQQYSMVTLEDPDVPHNLLHLLHMHFLKPTTGASSSATSGEPVLRCRTAMEYYIHGVNFRSCPISVIGNSKEARCILDVTMSGATLVVPRLNIDAETWRMLRNLMAIEQQNPEVGSHVTAYCAFMSQLACTARDVELLSRRGVMVHRLGNDDQVAELFSDLCKGIEFDADDPNSNYLRATCQEFEKCYRSRPRRWMAFLWQNYFANPWLAIGVMAAAMVLVCTLVQALYAVLSYSRQGQQ